MKFSKQEIINKIKEFYFKLNIAEKYSAFVDNLIIIGSIWFSIYLIAFYNDYLPVLDWHFYLDRILMFVIAFFLIYITLALLKPIIYVGMIIGAIYVLSVVFIDVYEDTRDPRKTEVKHIYEFEGADISGVFNKFLGNKPNNYTPENIMSIKNEVDSLKLMVNQLNNQLDSLKQNKKK